MRDLDGGCELAGRLDRETAEMLRAALSRWPHPVRPPMSRSTCALLPNVTLTPWSSSPSARWPTVSCPPRAVNAPRPW
ncbi:MAG TPA: hypothetical protein VF003_14040 [Pseudonocardiaceae bacterium]